MLVEYWCKMSLFKYFKRDSPLLSQSGPLSWEILLTAIATANDGVSQSLKKAGDLNGKGVKQQGS